jgi:hypothetical protein
MLGAAGWTELALIILGALGCPTRIGVTALGLPSSSGSATPVTSPTPARQTGPDDPIGDRVAEAAAALAADVLARSVIVEALARMPIRVERPLARVWAVIAIAEAAPSALLRADVADVIDAVADHFVRPADWGETGFVAAGGSVRTRDSDAMTGRPGGDEPAGVGSEIGVTDARSKTATSEAAESSDADADPDQPAQTLWAGILFFLNTAAEVGIPDAILADPALGRYPLWRILSAIGQSMMPISADDPALLALCGLQHQVAAAPLTDEDQALAETFASRWIARTAERMDLIDDDPADVCLRVALRRGSIVAEAGWIEVHLDLDDVDIDVRRAGLDLDPGWIPWLGCVVRFCYD